MKILLSWKCTYSMKSCKKFQMGLIPLLWKTSNKLPGEIAWIFSTFVQLLVFFCQSNFFVHQQWLSSHYVSLLSLLHMFFLGFPLKKVLFSSLSQYKMDLCRKVTKKATTKWIIIIYLLEGHWKLCWVILATLFCVNK